MVSKLTKHRLLKPFYQGIPAIRHLRCFTTFVVFPLMALHRIRCSSRLGIIPTNTFHRAVDTLTVPFYALGLS